MKVKKGDKIKVEYTGTFEDGKVFDSSSHGDHSHPLEFEVGKGMVIKGFEEAVIGMELNEEKEVKIKSNGAYGERDEKKIIKIPRDKLPKDQEPKVGMMLGMNSKDGRKTNAKIVAVGKEDISLDLNHPLVGKDLNFKLKIVGVN